MHLNTVLTEYLHSSRLGNNKVGLPVRKETGKWADSCKTHENGTPLHYQWIWNKFIIDIVVTPEDVISGMVLHLKHWDKPFEVQLGKHRLVLAKATSLDELLRCFNQAGVDWEFHFIFEKVVMVQLAESQVQFLFSYYPGESNELQIIQTGPSYRSR